LQSFFSSSLNGEDACYVLQQNSLVFTTFEDAISNTMSGKIFTWESYDSYHNGTPIVKAKDSNFAPAYYAANFYNSIDLTGKLGGKTLAATLNKDQVWYLPSFNEWKEVFMKLGFGVQINKWSESPWKGKMAHYAFTSANGASIVDTNIFYWSSSEYTPYHLNVAHVCSVSPSSSTLYFFADYKWGFDNVRPFVSF